MSAHRPLLCAALALAAAPAPSAQPDLPPIAWERVGDLQAGRDLLFSPGPTGDTLLAVGNGGEFGNLGVYRYAPGGAWSDDLLDIAASPKFLVRLPTETLLGGSPSGPTEVNRSADNGRTWARIEAEGGTRCFLSRPTRGDVLACADRAEYGTWRSVDDGQSWVPLGRIPADEPSVANALIEHASAGPGGAARLVAAVQNGLAYSDDDGLTWTRSNVWGAFRWWGDDLAHAAPVGPDAGGLYAAMSDFNDARAVVLYSADGGATWEERGRPLIGFSTLAVGPGGALYLGVDNAQPGDGAKLMRSLDGGRTWSAMIEGYPNTCVETLAISPSDGRLYLGGCSGAWRTTEPLPISTEEEPAGNASAPAVGAAYPNPASDRLTVPVHTAAPVPVRIALYDVLGRLVAGTTTPVEAEAQAVTLSVAAVPAGVYVMQVSADGKLNAQTVVVAK